MLGLLAGPARRLVAAPRGGERREREQEHGAELEPPLEAVGRRGLVGLRQRVRRVDMDVTHRPSVTNAAATGVIRSG